MKAPRRSNLALVVVAVTALVLGSLGVATAAAPLTKSAVKKIAKGVVQKQAPKLTVKNAQTVDGLEGAALQTKAYRFTLPSEALATTQSYTFPSLPVGKYLASYSITTGNSAPGATLTCAFIDTVEGGNAVASYSSGYASNTRVNASGVVTTTASTDLLCAMADGTFSVDATTSSVSFVPVDTLVAGGATS